MGRRKSSAVWEFFIEYEVDDRKVWECNLCKEVGDNKGNTSNLWSHLKNKKGKDGKNDKTHTEAFDSIKSAMKPPRKKAKVSTTQSRLCNESTDNETANESRDEDDAPATVSTDGNSSSSRPNTSESAGSSRYSSVASGHTVSSETSNASSSTSEVPNGNLPYSFSGVKMKAFLRILTLFIVRSMQPLSIVEDVNFRALIRHIDPRLLLPSRSTLTHSLIPELYREAKFKLMQKLSAVKWVALTADGWTSITNEGYLTVTVHYICDKMKTVSRVLSTWCIEVSHTAENLAKELRDLVSEWKLTDKIAAVVTDNANNIVKAVNDINKWRHVPCFAHTLSLAVKDAIKKNLSLSGLFTQCRDIVTFFHHSNPATVKLTSLCAANGKSRSKLQQENNTRWNSQFTMIESLLALKDEVDATLLLMHRPDLLLTEFEWTILAGVRNILKPFDDITRDLSSQFYPSLSKVIPSIRILLFNLGAMQPTPRNTELEKLIKDLTDNLTSRFDQSLRKLTSTLVTTYLDPRFKKNGKFLTEGRGLSAEIAELRVESELRAAASRCPSSAIQSSAAVPSTSEKSIFESFHDQFVSLENANTSGQNANMTANIIINLKDYLSQPYMPWSSDPLEYWKSKQFDGSLLPFIEVVKKFFCIPATSVPSEAIFSAAGDLINENRSRLNPRHVDKILFLNRNA